MMYYLIKAYAEVNDLTEEQVQEKIEKGNISGTELFNSWLEYEGILNYTYTIIEIFKDCEKAGMKIE